MREVELHVSETHADAVAAILEDRDIDYATVGQGDEVVFQFPVPTAAVADVLDEVRDVGDDYEPHVVVTKAELVETSNFDELRKRYSPAIRKLAVAELHAKILEMQWPYQLYYVGTLLSVLAAASGLLLDQPALVIGAMVIAPQASSALAAPAGVLVGDWELFVSSVKEQALGLGMAIVGAMLFGLGLRQLAILPPSISVTGIELVGVRLAPSALSTVGALIAGVVGAFGYTTEQATSLIGVMIAAALIPAAAVVGLGIAWGVPLLAVGALLLLFVNILAINLGAFATLLALGYKPEWVAGGRSFRESIPSGQRLAVYTTLVLLLVSTCGTAFFTASNISFNRSVNREVEGAMNDAAYRNLTLTGVRSEQPAPAGMAGPTNVTVTVSRPSNRSYPDLASTLERGVQRRTGRDVTVTVEFTEAKTAHSATLS